MRARQRAPEVTALNPLQMLPVLVTAEGEAISQSMAIIECACVFAAARHCAHPQGG